MSASPIDNKKPHKKSTWKWWQSKKEEDFERDYASSVARSSLIVQHSIHSKESEDITSTTSIKSKPWVSNKITTDQAESIKRTSSLIHTTSISSSTVPVYNFQPEPSRSKSSDTILFSGIKAKFGKWVSNKNDSQ